MHFRRCTPLRKVQHERDARQVAGRASSGKPSSTLSTPHLNGRLRDMTRPPGAGDDPARRKYRTQPCPKHRRCPPNADAREEDLSHRKL